MNGTGFILSEKRSGVFGEYIMGHWDISITVDTYTHLKVEDAQTAFERVMKV